MSGHWEPGAPVWVVDTPAYDIPHAAVPVASEGFETGNGGWAAQTNCTLTRASGTSHSGTYYVYATNTASGAFTIAATFTGLTVGAQYTLDGWTGRNFNTVTTIGFAVTSIGSGATVTPASTSVIDTALPTYTFTATATSHEVVVTGTCSGTGRRFYFDDFALVQAAWTEHVAEVGHWETGPDVWVPDAAAYLATPVEKLTYTRCTITQGATAIVLRPYVTGASVTLDVDRVPYVQAQITLSGVPDDLRVQLDPRYAAGAMLDFRAERDTGTAVDRDYFPGSTGYGGARAATVASQLLVTEVTYSELSDTMTITACSVEQMMMDKIRAATTVLDTAQTTVGALVGYAVNAIFGSSVFTDRVASTSIALPAGDRRLMQPGETYWDLIETETNAQGWRLFADLDGRLALSTREDGPQGAGAGTITAWTGVPALTDMKVTDITQTLNRADWANSAVARYSYLDSTGASKTAIQAYGGGSEKGIVVSYDRAPTSTNLAQGVATRTNRRGSAYEVTGSLDFNARPGRDLVLRRPDAARATRALGTIRATTWDFTTATMTLKVESAPWA